MVFSLSPNMASCPSKSLGKHVAKAGFQPSSARLQSQGVWRISKRSGIQLAGQPGVPCPRATAHIFQSHSFPVSSRRVITHLLFALLHFQGREMCPEGEKFGVNFLFPGSPNPGSYTRCLAPVSLAVLLPFPAVWRAAEMSPEKPGAGGGCCTLSRSTAAPPTFWEGWGEGLGRAQVSRNRGASLR